MRIFCFSQYVVFLVCLTCNIYTLIVNTLNNMVKYILSLTVLLRTLVHTAITLYSLQAHHIDNCNLSALVLSVIYKH